MDEGTKNVAFFILGRIADFMSSVHSPKAFLEGSMKGNRPLPQKERFPATKLYCAFSSVMPTVISCASRQASSSLPLRGCTTISPGVRIILRREETGLPSA